MESVEDNIAAYSSVPLVVEVVRERLLDPDEDETVRMNCMGALQTCEPTDELVDAVRAVAKGEDDLARWDRK